MSTALLDPQSSDDDRVTARPADDDGMADDAAGSENQFVPFAVAGALFAVLLITFLAPVVASFALKFGPAEFFAVASEAFFCAPARVAAAAPALYDALAGFYRQDPRRWAGAPVDPGPTAPAR